ncbi:MAG TPA: outer membrane protein [Methylovirgula sp.]|nr:outer membrane protein [Methylovirgula sp.]
MIRKLIAAAAFCAASSAALAADLPTTKGPPVFTPPPTPIFTWTGFYIGGQVGYAFGNSNANYAVTGNGPVVTSTSFHRDGVIGGGHAGYNWQFGGPQSFVIGIEGDINGTSANGSVPVAGVGAFPGGTAGARSLLEGSIRGRVGYAFDRVLIYGTGGVAFADFKNSYATAIGLDNPYHSSVGWTVGGGIEYAIDSNWSVRAEYRYSDFTRYSENLINSTGTAFDGRYHETEQQAQAGFSYRFDFAPPPTPVVAKY